MMSYTCEVLGRASKTEKDYAESMERYLPGFMELRMDIVVKSIYDILDMKSLQSIYDRIKIIRNGCIITIILTLLHL